MVIDGPDPVRFLETIVQCIVALKELRSAFRDLQVSTPATETTGHRSSQSLDERALVSLSAKTASLVEHTARLIAQYRRPRRATVSVLHRYAYPSHASRVLTDELVLISRPWRFFRALTPIQNNKLEPKISLRPQPVNASNATTTRTRTRKNRSQVNCAIFFAQISVNLVHSRRPCNQQRNS